MPGGLDGGPEKTLERLKDPVTRETLKKYDNPQYKHFSEGKWDQVILYNAKVNAALNLKNLEQIASLREVKDSYDALFDT
jgi:hypothetical protein